MKIGKDSTLGFSSSYWTNDALLNENALPDVEGNAKYAPFISQPFSKIKICIESPTENCMEHTFSDVYANAKALFSGGFIRDATINQTQILSAFNPTPGTYADCGMQRPGFNIECTQGNKARWGYCTNCASQECQTSDYDDADAAIGIGLQGQSTPAMGAGWTNYFASGSGICSPNSMTYKAVWMYVQPATSGVHILQYPATDCPAGTATIDDDTACKTLAEANDLTFSSACCTNDGNWIHGCFHLSSNNQVYWNERPGAVTGNVGGDRVCQVPPTNGPALELKNVVVQCGGVVPTN